MRIGPFPDILWRVICAEPRYYRRLGYPSSPTGDINLQKVARFLLEVEKPERFAELARKSPSFKTDHHRDQIKAFFEGDPERAVIGLKLMRGLQFAEADVQRVMTPGPQILEIEDLNIRQGKLADAADMESLGRAHLGDLQSPASRIQARMQAGLEHSRIAEDEESHVLRGFLRWWVVNSQGVRQILDGHALTGRDLRDSDLSIAPYPPGGGLYVVMLLGTDDVSRFRILVDCINLVKKYERSGLSTFTRPTTPIGFKLVERPSRRFNRVGHARSHIFVRQPEGAAR